jgi:hypothetical protein
MEAALTAISLLSFTSLLFAWIALPHGETRAGSRAVSAQPAATAV